MSAYVVVEVEVLDKERYELYKELTPASIEAYGGRLIVRGGAVETLEGEGPSRRLVIVEFPSVAQAKTWWASAEYAEAKALRQQIARTQMIVVEGV